MPGMIKQVDNLHEVFILDKDTEISYNSLVLKQELTGS